MASGYTGNVVPRKGLWVRVPCPPLRLWPLPHALKHSQQRRSKQRLESRGSARRRLMPICLFSAAVLLRFATASAARDLGTQLAAAQEQYLTGDFNAALQRLEPLLAADELDQPSKQRIRELAARILQSRGEEHFRQARIAEATADFDRQVKLRPEQAAEHWQRGIAYYYAGEYENGVRQFELHQTVNPHDVENAAWHFLCVVRAPKGSIETARKKLIPVTRDSRIPMAQIQQLFAGSMTPEEVLRVGEEAGGTASFYADLYVGLYYEALDRNNESLRLVSRAANNPAARKNYMGDVARVHVLLRKKTVTECVAGTGAPENNGDTGAASTINIGAPFGVEIGPDGALYITEVQHHRVRRLDLAKRELVTVAGCGIRGYSGDAGPAAAAKLNEPYEVRFDRDGNMFIVEMKNHVVRRVDAQSQTISTVAGTGDQGFSGDGGPAVKATFSQPHSIAIDRQGAIYIADIGNHRIRRVDPKTGIVDTIAGNSQRTPPRDRQIAIGNPILGPRALFIDGDTLWIALREGHSVWRIELTDGILHHVAGTGNAGYTGDGGPAIKAKFNGPKGIAVSSRQVLVTDSGNNVIRRVDLKSGLIATIAGDKTQGKHLATQRSGALDISLKQPHGLCVAPDGALFIGDTLNHRVLRVH